MEYKLCLWMTAINFVSQFRHNIQKLRRICLRFLFCCVCATSRLSTFHIDRCRLWLLPVSRLCEVVPLRCVRALNFVHYVRCVKTFYARRLHTLRALLQKPPYVVAVVEFCVYLIHLSLWYCKVAATLFSAFLVLCFSWSQKIALCFIALLFSPCGGIAAGVQTVNFDHVWSELWHVNSLQSLC